jgi:hypothetical protein
VRRGLAVALLALLLAACGGESAGSGSAELWVTRDRGQEVVLTATVPAGLTVLQALDREADVETRYGGRYVQAVNGVEGSLADRRDWFYFLNGIEPGKGAAEVVLRAGDVAWWDYRSWQGDAQHARVVVGAFPEPFRRGWRARPVKVRAPPELADAAAALRDLLGPGSGEGEPNVFVLEVEPGADGAVLTATRGDADGSPVTFTLAGEEEAVRAAALRLAEDPAVVRYRYEARFP